MVVWIVLGLLTVPMFLFAPKDSRRRKIKASFSECRGARDATIDQTAFYTDAANVELMKIPSAAKLPNHFSEAIRRPGAQTLGGTQAHRFQVRARRTSKVNSIPGIRTYAATLRHCQVAVKSRRIVLCAHSGTRS